MTIHITYRKGSGGLFDRVRWRCSGTSSGCGPWMASAWDWAPAMAAEHVATCHPNADVRGLVSSAELGPVAELELVL